MISPRIEELLIEEEIKENPEKPNAINIPTDNSSNSRKEENSNNIPVEESNI